MGLKEPTVADEAFFNEFIARRDAVGLQEIFERQSDVAWHLLVRRLSVMDRVWLGRAGVHVPGV